MLPTPSRSRRIRLILSLLAAAFLASVALLRPFDPTTRNFLLGTAVLVVFNGFFVDRLRRR